MESGLFIPIISDYGFKATFGNEANTLFTRRALQALIKSDVSIEQVTFLPNELSRITKDGRSGIYDLACRDTEGNFFIVEMQLSEYPEFIQRMKFYSLYRLNTLIKRGKYTFDDLPRIYCIGILAIDEQTTFVTIELARFGKLLSEVSTDLDKLIYTMKTVHTVTDLSQYPQFWTEEWLQTAIDELDKRAMTPEELLDYEMTLSANALAIKNEQLKIQAAEERGVTKTLAVTKRLLQGEATVEEIAKANEVPVSFVRSIQQQLNRED